MQDVVLEQYAKNGVSFNRYEHDYLKLVNVFKDDKKISLFCVHPGWIWSNVKLD